MHSLRFARRFARRLAGRIAVIAFGGLCFGGEIAWCQGDDWLVPEATVRYTLKLVDTPTHLSSGYFAVIPDGGAFPGGFPMTTVFAEARREGAKVERSKSKRGAALGGGDYFRVDGSLPAGEMVPVNSFQLWHSRANGLAMVFADPGPGANVVHVYISPSTAPRLWRPESGLHPSAILAVDPTGGDLGAARRLGDLGAAGPTMHVRNKAGWDKRAPFSIGGDASGRPQPGSFYMLSHVVTKEAGRTWIAPFTQAGVTEVFVNGQKLIPQKRIKKWGGTGAWFDLKAGLNRVEVFQTAEGTGPYSNHSKNGGLMYLTWRTPQMSIKELGGERSQKVPMPGTSRMETRILKPEEIARSGRCRVVSVAGRKGEAVASVRIKPTQIFWFGEEEPLLSYEFQAIVEGNPEDTTYAWLFPGGGEVRRETARWLFPAFRENAVKLRATSAAGTSEVTLPFFGFATVSTNLDVPEHREAFRASCTEMLLGNRDEPDAVAKWSSAYWNNIIRTLELGEGYALLRNLLGDRVELTRARLTPDQLAAVQDVFLDMAQMRDAEEAYRLIELFHGETLVENQRDELLIRKAEVLMYYLDDLEKANQGLTAIAEGGEGKAGVQAKVRLGDLAFLEGDLNGAAGYYAEVQKLARERRNRIDAVPDGLITRGLLAPEGTIVPGEEESKGRRRKDDEMEPEEAAPEEALAEAPVLPAGGAAWNIDALVDVSISENIASLIEGGYFMEAREGLRAWELEFPLSKISGDYILLESRFYMKLGDWKRARAMLEAYCREMDASSFLPEAVRMLVECARELEVSPEDLRELLERVRGSLKFHPVAEELEAYLAPGK